MTHAVVSHLAVASDGRSDAAPALRRLPLIDDLSRLLDDGLRQRHSHAGQVLGRGDGRTMAAAAALRAGHRRRRIQLGAGSSRWVFGVCCLLSGFVMRTWL